MSELARLTLVVPCYNEEETLTVTIPKFVDILINLVSLELITDDSKILFIDDGSEDNTWDIIKSESVNSRITGLKLSKNFGHQNALLAGLMHVDTDISISIDADLQDDPEVISNMILAYYEGAEIVYGVRYDRTVDTFFKRFFAQKYYKVLRMIGVNIVNDHADFRLMSKKSLEALKDFKEVNLFLRGIIPIIGFKSKKVYYTRLIREVGTTKYNVRKIFKLALDGITSFSVIPLLFIIWIGIIISLVSGVLGVWALVTKFLIGGTVQGWTSIVVPMYFLGGIQLLTLGIIGIYISKVYLEVKARPRFIIEDIAD